MEAHSLPKEFFPFTVTAMDEDTGEILQEEFVEGPGVMKIEGHQPRHVMIVASYPQFSAVTLSDGTEIGPIFKEGNG